MSGNSSEGFNFGNDTETGIELIFMSGFLWFVVMTGFKINSDYGYINIKEMGLSYLSFFFLMILYFLVTIIASFKLAVKYTKTEFVFVYLFAGVNGAIFHALLENLMLVNNLNVKPYVIGFSFCGALLIGTMVTSLLGFIEQKMGIFLGYLSPFSLLIIFGVFFLILSFSGNSFDEIKKYFAFVFPMLLINGLYSSTIYRAYKSSKTYINAQLTNISSILFLPPLLIVGFMCF